jgi:hypothetical protein
MTGLVMAGGMEASLMLFALIDASSAVWTWHTLRRPAAD